jgi:cobalamin biosynthesis protein CbiG
MSADFLPLDHRIYPPRTVAAARALAARNAEVCGTDPEDVWKFYSEDFLADAQAALDAADAVADPIPVGDAQDSDFGAYLEASA